MAGSVGEMLRLRATELPDKPFVKCGGAWLSYGWLDHRTDELAAGLAAQGVKSGDRVALIIPNRQEMIELFFALAKLGAIQVPLNYWLKGEFLRHQIGDCGASVLIADEPGYRAALPLLHLTDVQKVILLDAVEVDSHPVDVTEFGELLTHGSTPPDVRLSNKDLIAILYTSGTTGLPKGCMMCHGQYTWLPKPYIEAGLCEPSDRIFTAFPFFHTSGQLLTLMPALGVGASACFEEEFSASRFMARAVEEKATILLGVAAMGLAILATEPSVHDADHAFRYATWIPMPPAAQLEFERRFAAPVIGDGYGQTEVIPVVGTIDGTQSRGAIGRPIADVDLRIFGDDENEVPQGEVGEIVVRPRLPYIMFQGYWNRPEATVEAARNLWHHTGDCGYIGDDGCVYFMDRKKDAMRRRGENVSSVQVERTLAEHPKIAAAAVHAVPSPMAEDDIKAVLVLLPDEELKPDEIFEYCRENLPYFAIPRYVEVRGALPTNALGRVMKQQLRDEGVTDATWDLDALGFAVAKADRRG